MIKEYLFKVTKKQYIKVSATNKEDAYELAEENSLIDTSDEELKRMSREIYQDETTEAAYLKGSLQATKDHLQDMRTLVFKNSEVTNENRT